MYDIIIIGSGPAGLSAAIYALRADKSTLIIEKGGFGGQMTFSPKIENYPAFNEISGSELADRMVEQVISQGGEFEYADVIGVRANDGSVTVFTDSGNFEAKAVIIASGARHRVLGLPNESELVGHGISYCAVCDGAFARGAEAVIVGGGNSALQEALLLSDLVKHLTVVQNLDRLTGEERLQAKLKECDNVDYLYSTTVTSLNAGEDGELSSLTVKDKNGTETELKCDSLFVAIGLEPKNEAFAEVAELNEYGYIVTDGSCACRAPGVYAAGDCRVKTVRQIATAISDGAVAALSAISYID